MKMHVWIAGAALLPTGTSLTQAATYTVANTGANGGVNPPVGAGIGTLRQAILDSNAASGSNTIAFNISGGVAGPFTIVLAARFITGSVAIDGFSQLGTAANTNTPDQGPLAA